MSAGAFIGAILLKPALVAAGAALIALLFARRGAAARHAIWTGAIGALLCLPLLSAVLPPLRLGALTDVVARAADEKPEPHIALPVSTSPRTMLDAPVPHHRSANFANMTWALWALVALGLVVRRVRSEFAARRIVTAGRPASPELLARCAAIAHAKGLSPVAVAISDQAACPAVTGIVHPVVVLPAAAETWTDQQIVAVLSHELTHVVRRDCLTNLVADLTAALYWCNPMVHFAARRIRAEAERACDDDVVREGTDPDGYALLLLDFARSVPTAHPLPRAATAVARPSELESRVIAVLNPSIMRAPLSRRTANSLAIASMILALPVGAATLAAAPPAFVQRIGGSEPDQSADSISRGERLPSVDEVAARAGARRALAGPDSAVAARLVGALSHVPTHDNDLIRERAAWALAQTRGDRLMEPVVEALDAGDWRVQAYAAWTVAVARERRGVPRLIGLVRHPVWRVRAMAAFALCELADRRAVDVMIGALSDPAWQVRMEAVEYLAALGDPPYQDRIRVTLGDRHVAVRRAAARALHVE